MIAPRTFVLIFRAESPELLSEMLSAQNVRVPLESRTKADLLRELVALALGDDLPEAAAQVLSAVNSRETEVSTAMGGGLALPHGRTEHVDRVRVAAGLVRGVGDYAAADGEPVRVAFLLLSPPGESGSHVRLLARIGRLMHVKSSREALLAASGVEAFLGVVRESEATRSAIHT